MITFNIIKKKIEEKEQREKLDAARDLWLNYENHYILYDIQYIDPITKKIKTFGYPFKITRKMQREEKEHYSTIAMNRSRGFLNKEIAYWNGDSKKGIVISNPVQVKFKEISKKEFETISFF